MTLPSAHNDVRLYEVGPRDGLQNEPRHIETADKLAYIALLVASGLREVEATSFVSPRWVPQLADHVELVNNLPTDDGVRYPVLVPNMKGLERASAQGVKAVALFLSATDTFNTKNINRTTEQALAEYAEMAQLARERGIWLRGYLSCAFGCPYEDQVPISRVVRVAERLVDMGCDEISLGDTIGVADPLQVRTVVAATAASVPLSRIALHLHDTRGTALANLCAGLAEGIRCFDTASGGVGGCPFAPGAAGNLATEEAVYVLERMGLRTGVSLSGVVAASRFLAGKLGRNLPSRLLQSEAACQTNRQQPASPSA